MSDGMRDEHEDGTPDEPETTEPVTGDEEAVVSGGPEAAPDIEDDADGEDADEDLTDDADQDGPEDPDDGRSGVEEVDEPSTEPPAQTPAAIDGEDGPTGDATGDVPASASGWRGFGREMRPRANRSQLLVAVLCAALGFALVVQVQQSAQDPLTSARQDDLVRLLDEVTQRSEQLQGEVADLSGTRDELQSGSGQAQAAVELAEERASAEGILSGRLPAVGPGLEIVINDPDGLLEASELFNVLEELRNAGAEVIELNDVRLVTSTWFLDSEDGITMDGHVLTSPYRWTVIGDPGTLNPALEIPGGALATVRTAGAQAVTTDHDEVEVDAVREPSEPEFATPHRPED